MEHEFRERLIDLVREYPCLYDASATGYSNNAKKVEVWQEIASKLNSTAALCKSKWNITRDSFRRSLVKESSRVRKSSGIILNSYRYAEKLEFVRQFLRGCDDESLNQGCGSKAKEDDDQYEEGDEEGDEEGNEEENEELVDTQMIALCRDIGDTEEYSPSDGILIKCEECDPLPVSDVEDYTKVVSTDPPTRSQPTPTLSVSDREPTSTGALELVTSNYAHPVDAFLAGIAPALKDMSPYNLGLAKAEIFAAVHKYEMRSIMERKKRAQSRQSQPKKRGRMR